MGWGLGEKVTNEDIIEAIIELYPELHQVRNALDPFGEEPHSMYGCLKHTLVNLQNILGYYKKEET